MRSNSQVPRRPAVRPILANKSILSTRPQTRRTSVQNQIKKTNTRFPETQVRPRKCPNCGSTFSSAQYVDNFSFRPATYDTALDTRRKNA